MDGDFIEIPDPYIIIHIHIHSFIYIQMTYRGYLFFFFKVEHIIEVNFTSGFNANTLLVFNYVTKKDSVVHCHRKGENTYCFSVS